MTPHNPDDQAFPRSRRLSRRRMLQGAATGAGALVVLPVTGVVGAPFALLHDDHEDDDKKDDDRDRSDDHEDDDHEDRVSGGEDDEETPVSSAGEAPAGSTVVQIDDDDEDGFSPGSVDIEVGQSVTFVNLDDDPHTATSIDWDTGIIEPGEMAAITFDEPGEFPYACQIHPVMTGVINVHGPEGSPAATPEASPEASPVSATPATMAGETVSIVDFAFDPQDIEVPAGTTVTWTNQDTVPHTATSLDGDFDTGTLENGASGSHTFDTPGTYEYQCAFHPNMTGAVVVV